VRRQASGEVRPGRFPGGGFGRHDSGGWRQQYPRPTAAGDQYPFAVVGEFGILVKVLHRFLCADRFHLGQLCRTGDEGSSWSGHDAESTWQPLVALTLTTRTTNWVDMASATQPKRFYRAVPLP